MSSERWVLDILNSLQAGLNKGYFSAYTNYVVTHWSSTFNGNTLRQIQCPRLDVFLAAVHHKSSTSLNKSSCGKVSITFNSYSHTSHGQKPTKIFGILRKGPVVTPKKPKKGLRIERNTTVFGGDPVITLAETYPLVPWLGGEDLAATGGDRSTVTTANGKTFFYNNVFGGYWLADLLNESWTWVVDHINGLHLGSWWGGHRASRIPTVSVRIGQVTPLDSDAQRDAAGEIGSTLTVYSEFSVFEFIFFFATSLRGVARFGFAFISDRTHGCDVGHCIVGSAAVQMAWYHLHASILSWQMQGRSSGLRHCLFRHTPNPVRYDL
ncbi:hypothetical protein DFH08DRAFT_806872 [Mycena albidolilacea]|uniref:Uncharacterized protein n=1 Tax=Mycena albidolilacea TaxID=1033008 RepID=A0AAD7A7V0_9AGAR|nr:hypothetical protein DFH08DRAFT_806872 [Mycena albidolilacea]